MTWWQASPKASHPRDQGGSCSAFYDLASEAKIGWQGKKTCFLFRFVLFFSSLKTVFGWDWGSEHDGIIFHDLKKNDEKVEITSCCGNCRRGADRNRSLCVPVRMYGPQLDDGQPVWVYPGPKQVLARWGPKRWFLQRQHHKLEVDAVTGNDGGGVASPMTLRGGGGGVAGRGKREHKAKGRSYVLQSGNFLWQIGMWARRGRLWGCLETPGNDGKGVHLAVKPMVSPAVTTWVQRTVWSHLWMMIIDPFAIYIAYHVYMSQPASSNHQPRRVSSVLFLHKNTHSKQSNKLWWN